MAQHHLRWALDRVFLTGPAARCRIRNSRQLHFIKKRFPRERLTVGLVKMSILQQLTDTSEVKRIIEIAKSGERDPNQLRDKALTAFGDKRLILLLLLNLPSRCQTKAPSGTQVGAVFMRSTKPKDFRSIPSACIDAQAASRRTLCGDPSNSASKSRTISRSKRAASGSVVSCSITR